MSRNKEVKFNDEYEIEVSGSCTLFRKGKGPSMDHAGGEPDEPEEVEDLYVGIIIKGVAIDITSLLNKKQKEHFEARCLETAAEDDRP